jgi:hypothetical protein
VMNNIPGNGSLINTHTSNNNIMNYGSNMIMNIEVTGSSPQYYGVGSIRVDIIVVTKEWVILQ